MTAHLLSKLVKKRKMRPPHSMFNVTYKEPLAGHFLPNYCLYYTISNNKNNMGRNLSAYVCCIFFCVFCNLISRVQYTNDNIIHNCFLQDIWFLKWLALLYIVC